MGRAYGFYGVKKGSTAMDLIWKHEVRDHMKFLGVNGMRILCVFEKEDEGKVSIGFVCPRTGTSVGNFLMR
jgi:hypothetical protein